MGIGSLYSNNDGHGNTASGYQALYSSYTGDENTANGFQALFPNTGGEQNTASGYGALYNNTTGRGNTAVGGFADVTSPSLNNATAIGYNARVSASNTIVIGHTDVTVIGGYTNWSNLSDCRYKRDVQDDIKGLDFIIRLRPVSFKMDLQALEARMGVSCCRSDFRCIWEWRSIANTP